MRGAGLVTWSPARFAGRFLVAQGDERVARTAFDQAQRLFVMGERGVVVRPPLEEPPFFRGELEETRLASRRVEGEQPHRIDAVAGDPADAARGDRGFDRAANL